MLKAFNNDFINEMKDKYNDFKDKTNAQIFYDWVNSFKYEFGNLFPEPESITIDNNTKKLDNLLKLKELGANIADIEAELNEDEIFKNEMDLDGEQPDFTEDDNLDNDNIDNKIDYNMYRFIDDNKDFDESKINRNAKGQFAEKNETGDGDNDKKDNSKDNDKQKDNKDNLNITDNDRIKFISDIDDLISGMSKRNAIGDKRSEGIKKLIESGKLGDIKVIDNDIKYNRELENNDKDKYNKYIEYKKTEEYKKELETAINQFDGETKSTAEKLLPENLKAGELILDDKFQYSKEIDKDKIKKLNPIEKAINYFTEDWKNRNKKGYKQYQKEIKDLINKSMPKEISLYRYETEISGKKRYNLKVGDSIDMSVRSFCNSEDAFDSCRTLQLRNREPNECVIYKIDGKVKSLEIQSLSRYTGQKEHIVDGDFEITEIREATNLMPKIITIKARA